MKPTVLAFLVLGAAAYPAHADECDMLMENLQSKVHGIRLDQRTKVTAAFDIFYFADRTVPQPFSIYCGQKVLSVNLDWTVDSPPHREFWTLIKSLAAALNLAGDDFGAALSSCVNQADAANSDDDDEAATASVESSKSLLSCGNAGHRTQVTIARRD